MTPLDTADVARFATLIVTTCACACGVTVTVSEVHGPELRDSWRRSTGKRLPELRGWTLGQVAEPDPKRPGKTRHRQQTLCPVCTAKLRTEERALGRWEKRYATFLGTLVERMKADVKGARRAEVEAWFQAHPPPPSHEKYGVENAHDEAIQKALTTHLEAIAAPANPADASA